MHIYADKTTESHFAEIINPNEKNSVIGVIYRHPTGDSHDFLETHLKPLVQNKLSKEIINKKVYLAGAMILLIFPVRKHLNYLIS